MKATKSVTYTGPLFTHDPSKTFRANARVMLKAMADEGQALARDTWPTLTGEGRAGTIGRVQSLSGRPWALYMVVSAQHVYAWPHGGAKQYRGGKVEAKRHMFRRAATSLRSSRALNRAELAKGMD
jgi:hypothetical protein